MPKISLTNIFSVTTTYLLRRLKRSARGWDRAMAHAAYPFPDDAEEKPFTTIEAVRYWWADSWRQEHNWLENQLLQQSDVRAGLCLGFSEQQDPVYHDPA